MQPFYPALCVIDTTELIVFGTGRLLGDTVEYIQQPQQGHDLSMLWTKIESAWSLPAILDSRARMVRLMCVHSYTEYEQF